MDAFGNFVAGCLQFLGRGCHGGDIAAGDFGGGSDAFDQLGKLAGITFHGLRHIIGAPGLEADLGNDVVGFTFDDFRHRLNFRGRTLVGQNGLARRYQAAHIRHQQASRRISRRSAALGPRGKRCAKCRNLVVGQYNVIGCQSDDRIGQNVLIKALVECIRAVCIDQRCKTSGQFGNMMLRITWRSTAFPGPQQFGDQIFCKLFSMLRKQFRGGIYTRIDCTFWHCRAVIHLPFSPLFPADFLPDFFTDFQWSACAFGECITTGKSKIYHTLG